MIWVLIFLSLAFYHFKSSLNKSKFNFKSLTGLVSLIFSIYLISGLYNNSNVRFLSGILPPEFYTIKNSENQCPLGLNCYKSFEEGRSYALENEKLVLLDFTGWACVNCRKIEDDVWVEKRVKELLNNEYVVISLYVDEKTDKEYDFADLIQMISDVEGIERIRFTSPHPKEFHKKLLS